MSKKRIILYIILLSAVALTLLPVYSAFTTSVKTVQATAATNPLVFPSNPTLSPWVKAFNALRNPLINSAIITGGGVFGSVFLGSIAGYVFSKIRFKYDTYIFILLAIGAFIPYHAVLVPLFATINTFGLIGHRLGLIIAHTAYGIPICALLFRNFYGEIPQSVVNQAKVDGAGDWKIYFRIILPNTLIATVTVATLQFTSIWNDYLFGAVLGGAPTQAQPATVALKNILGTYAAMWNTQMAGSIIVALPVLVVYIIAGKYLIRGYMAGAVKG